MTLYTVGTVKDIPGVRRYVAVDGGMSDNPRPVLYGSGYETFLPKSVKAERSLKVRVVGKHCESGDVLVRDGVVPDHLEVGDVLATPVTGVWALHGIELQQSAETCGGIRRRRRGQAGRGSGELRRLDPQ